MKIYDDQDKLDALVKSLKRHGYTSYGVALQQLGTRWTDEKGVIGFTNPQGIVINGTLNINEQSLVARHEVLHTLLRHLDDKIWGDGRDDHEIRNMAGDLELSHYYDEVDSRHFNIGGPLAGGLNVQRRAHNKYYGKDAIEIYDDLIKNGKAKGKPLGDCIQGDGKGQSSGASAGDLDDKKKQDTSVSPSPQPGGMSDKVKKDLLKKIKVERQERYEQADIQKGLRDEVDIDAELELFYSLNRYFIKEQQLSRNKSYARPNKKYQGAIVKKGRRKTRSPGKTLVVYIDRSGSMSDEKTGKAERILANTVKRLNHVTVITKYFSDEVSLSGNIGGGTNYSAVIDDININKYRDVAIVTDNDNDGRMNVADVDAVWIVSVEPGYGTRIANRFNATMLVETEIR